MSSIKNSNEKLSYIKGNLLVSDMKNLQHLQKKYETNCPVRFKPFSNSKNINNLTSNNKIINIIRNNQNDNIKKNLFLKNTHLKINNIFNGRSYTFDTNKKILNSKINGVTINTNDINLNQEYTKTIPIKVSLGKKEIKIKLINYENKISNNENVIKRSCYQGLPCNILPRISLSNFHKNDRKENNNNLFYFKTSENIGFQNLTFNSLKTFRNKNNNLIKENTPNKRLFNINKLKIFDKKKFNKTFGIKINLNEINNSNDKLALNRTNPMFFLKDKQYIINSEKNVKDNYNTEEYKNNDEKDENIEDNKSNNSDKDPDPRIDFELINRLNRSRPQTSYGGLNARKKNLQYALHNENNLCIKNNTQF